MLNNKKSLLQRARIAMVAIVTIIGISSAFATTPIHNSADVTWGVVQTNANSYEVTAVTANSRCNPSSRVCKIHSSVAPDPLTSEISMDDAEPAQSGSFVK